MKPEYELYINHVVDTLGLIERHQALYADDEDLKTLALKQMSDNFEMFQTRYIELGLPPLDAQQLIRNEYARKLFAKLLSTEKETDD